MEIGLRVCALGLVLLGNLLPSLLGRGATADAQDDGVGKALVQHVRGHGVFILPRIDRVLLDVRRFVSVRGLGAGLLACEVGPTSRGFHLAAEAYDEDGPVGTIGLEMGDSGGGHDVAGGVQ